MSECRGIGDALLVDVDADDFASRELCDADRRAAGTTPDVKNQLLGPKPEPADEPLQLRSRKPAVLADVLSKRLPANLTVKPQSEVAINRVVVVGLRSG